MNIKESAQIIATMRIDEICQLAVILRDWKPSVSKALEEFIRRIPDYNGAPYDLAIELLEKAAE